MSCTVVAFRQSPSQRFVSIYFNFIQKTPGPIFICNFIAQNKLFIFQGLSNRLTSFFSCSGHNGQKRMIFQPLLPPPSPLPPQALLYAKVSVSIWRSRDRIPVTQSGEIVVFLFAIISTYMYNIFVM